MDIWEVLLGSGLISSVGMWLLDRRKRAAEIKQIKKEIENSDVERAHGSAKEWKDIAEMREVNNVAKDAKIDSLYVEIAKLRTRIDELTQENTALKVMITKLELLKCEILKCIKRIPPFLKNAESDE